MKAEQDAINEELALQESLERHSNASQIQEPLPAIQDQRQIPTDPEQAAMLWEKELQQQLELRQAHLAAKELEIAGMKALEDQQRLSMQAQQPPTAPIYNPFEVGPGHFEQLEDKEECFPWPWSNNDVPETFGRPTEAQ